MVLDRSLSFVAANDRYVEMVGLHRDQLVGGYVFDLFPETPERIEAMRDLFLRTLDGEVTSLEATPFALVRDGVRTEYWWSVHHYPLRDGSGDIVGIVQYSENVTDKMRLQKLNEAIMGELHHRISNLFTVISAIARMVARTAPDVASFMDRFQDKVEKLAQGQNALDTAPGQSADMSSIIKDQLGVYMKFAGDRIEFSGPDVAITSGQAKAISMVVHELATNSLKYGAIREENGRVTVSWDLTGDGDLRLNWAERGIPRADGRDASNLPTGYGSHLLTDLLPTQLNGTAKREFTETGLTYELAFTPVA